MIDKIVEENVITILKKFPELQKNTCFGLYFIQRKNKNYSCCLIHFYLKKNGAITFEKTDYSCIFCFVYLPQKKIICQLLIFF